MMKLLLFALIVAAAGGPAPSPSPADRENIALGMQIATRVGDRLWPQWSQTPFVIDLLTADGPVMVNADTPDPAPAFPTNLEATFPLSNGVPTIVIGEPQFTQAKTPVRWTVTLLHEHFHQWQWKWPAYQSAVKQLALAPPGDNNAMWMLNYPFPYSDPAVDSAYTVMARALSNALKAVGSGAFRRRAATFASARIAFQHALKPADYRYFAFQCWQEGVARYTEIAIARLAASAHRDDPAFLTDVQSHALAADADATYSRLLRRLDGADLKGDERVNFYALGAGEALVLDELHPEWRSQYLDARMDLAAITGSAPKQ